MKSLDEMYRAVSHTGLDGLFGAVARGARQRPRGAAPGSFSREGTRPGPSAAPFVNRKNVDDPR